MASRIGPRATTTAPSPTTITRSLDPKYAVAHFTRSRLNLFVGALPKALAGLHRANELDPKNAYAALWLDIANRRSNLPSRLAEATKQIDATKWPAAVMRLYLGQSI